MIIAQKNLKLLKKALRIFNLIFCILFFFQNKFKNLDGPAFDTLDGKNHKARFGLSVACAGNINLDGITSESPKGN